MEDVTREPSMEDILASIKRIIAEDAPPAPPARPRRAAAPSPPPQEEEAVMVDRPPSSDPVLELTEAVRQPGPASAGGAPAAPATAPDTPIVADSVAQASRQSLQALSALLIRPELGENTLEGMVREMLRPMLKEWLDARLPELVEGLVSREIARITKRDF